MEKITENKLILHGFNVKKTHGHSFTTSYYEKDGFKIIHMNAGEQFENWVYTIVKDNKTFFIKTMKQVEEEYLLVSGKNLKY